MTITLTLSAALFHFAATAATYEFECSSHGNLVLAVQVEVKSPENFKVFLMKRSGDRIPVTSEWISLDRNGYLKSVHTTGGWESFSVERDSSGDWEGEYWEDNVRYSLQCAQLIK